MARTTANGASSLRADLSAASAWLTKAGAPDHLSGAVDRVLAPGGWEMLRHTDPAKSSTGAETNMSISITMEIRQKILAAVAADPDAPSVTAKVNEGLQKFLDGSFTLPTRVGTKATQGLPGKWTTLTVRALKGLRDQVAERGPAPSKVAGEYLMLHYQLGPYAPDALTVLERGAERFPKIPRVVRDEIRRRAEESGWRTDDVINEGFQKFLDGSFDPAVPAWTDEARTDSVPMKVRPNDELYRRVSDAAKERTPKLRPLQVAVAYLLDEYGITVGVADPAE